jgi:hypothetical protein
MPNHQRGHGGHRRLLGFPSSRFWKRAALKSYWLTPAI